jgi:hypothetical protein
VGERLGVDVAVDDADVLGAGDGAEGVADAAGLRATWAPTDPVSTSRRATTRLTWDEGQASGIGGTFSGDATLGQSAAADPGRRAPRS